MTCRVALIGAETLSLRHARAWAALPDTEVVGVLTPFADENHLPVPVFTEWAALLADARPDIIDFCAAPPQCRDWTEQAAAAGKAVLLPLAGMLSSAEAGRAAMPTGLRRLSPEFAAVHRLVQAGGVGVPAAVRLSQFFCENGEGEEVVEGVLEQLTADFDWLRWTFGPVQRVFARGFFNQTLNRDVWDYALITLRFHSGAMAHVTGALTFGGSPRTTLEVAGDAGLVEHDSARTGPPPDVLAAELAAFVQALQSGTAPPVTRQEAGEAGQIARAVREALDTGKGVAL